MLYARTQEEIYIGIRTRIRDTSPNRWEPAEVYAALNNALDTWDNRVLIPHVHPITYVTNQREYALPSYMKMPIDPQYQEIPTEDTWCDLVAYEIRPNASGTLTLHLSYYPIPGDGRILWWSPNSRVPADAVALSAAIDEDDTSLTVDAAISVDEVGYVKVSNEWIGYAGVTPGSDTLTLTNLERGALGTTAVAHDDGTSVLWGVVAHRLDLFNALERQMMVWLHELFLTNGSAHETESHERIMNWHQQQLDKFWKAYTPARSPKVVLTAGAIGGPLWVGGRGFSHLSDRGKHT